MTENDLKRISLEVHISNEFKEAAKKELANVMPKLEKFVGKKIFTLNGNAKNFIIDFLRPKPTPFNNGFAKTDLCYLTEKYNKLVLVFRTCFNGGSHENRTAYSQHESRDFYLGEMGNNGTLTKLYDLNFIITDYGLNTVTDLTVELEALKAYLEAKETAEKLKRNVSPILRDFCR